MTESGMFKAVREVVREAVSDAVAPVREDITEIKTRIGSIESKQVKEAEWKGRMASDIRGVEGQVGRERDDRIAADAEIKTEMRNGDKKASGPGWKGVVGILAALLTGVAGIITAIKGSQDAKAEIREAHKPVDGSTVDRK